MSSSISIIENSAEEVSDINSQIIVFKENAENITKILDQIKELQTQTGMTVLLVSHSMEDVAEYVDRIIVMNQGSVLFDDTPHQVFAHYKELEEVGLAAPQVTYIMNALRENGFRVDTSVTTIKEAADEIMRAFQ